MSSLWKLWAHLKALWKSQYLNLLSNDSISSSYLFCDQGRPSGQFHLWDCRELCRPVCCYWKHNCLWLSQEDVCSGPSFTLFSACSSSINDVKLAYPTIGGIPYDLIWSIEPWFNFRLNTHSVYFTFDNDLTVMNITCNDSIIAGVSYNVSYGLLLHSDPVERSIASMKAKMWCPPTRNL